MSRCEPWQPVRDRPRRCGNPRAERARPRDSWAPDSAACEKAAAKNAGEALAVDGDNFKALYRLFLANFRRGAPHEAKPMLLRACKLDPENKTARRELWRS